MLLIHFLALIANRILEIWIVCSKLEFVDSKTNNKTQRLGAPLVNAFPSLIKNA